MADTGKIIALASSMVKPAAIEAAVTDWLDDHPEATTTVEDGAISYDKLDSSLKGTVDDVPALKSAIDKLTPDATAGDVGKAIIVKTVEDGKPTSYEYGEAGGGSDIDDTAGSGDTDKAWSADKLTTKFGAVDTFIAKDDGRTEIAYSDIGQVVTGGTTADVTTHTSNVNWRNAVVECSPYDTFIVNVVGGSDGRAWAFVAESGLVLARANSSVTCTDLCITAPENTKYLVLNDNNSGKISYKSAYNYYRFNNQQENLNYIFDNTYKKEKIQYTGTNQYIALNTTSGISVFNPVASNNWRFARVQCEEGDAFVINVFGGGSPRAWGFVDVEGNALARADSDSICIGTVLVAPANTAYLIINDKKTGLDSYSAQKVNTFVSKNTDSLDRALGAGANKGSFTNSNNVDSFVLLHFSDVHGSSKNMRNISLAREFLSDVLDDTLCTGDIVSAKYADTMSHWDKNSDGSILTCIGNHDVKDPNSTGYIAGQPSEADLYSKFMANYISKWGTVEHSNNNLYYYKDYDEKKIRLIVLNLLYPSSEKTTEQNTWLATALAGAKSAGYAVIIGQHYYPVSGTKISCTFSAEVNFPTSMSNPERYMYNGDALTTYQATVQDFIDGGGNFVCWLCGHKHADYIVYHPTYPKQVFIGVGCARAYGTDKEAEATTDMRRIEGTRSFDCMNIISVDPTQKVLEIIRVGCDRDFLNRHRGTLVLDYSTSPATVVYND